MDLPPALDLFTHKVREHLPSTEAAVRDLLAQAIRESEGIGLPDVEVEASSGRKRIDIVVHPSAAGLEIKYHRPIPSGRNRPMTQQYGALLGDVRKLADDPELSERYVFLLTDRAGYTHIVNKNLLSTAWDREKPITASKIRGLAQTANRSATAGGPWIDVLTRMIWHSKIVGPDRLTGVAWMVRVTS